MGNYIKDLLITYSGKESEKEFMYRCMCITESLCHTNETNTALLINCTSIKKKVCIQKELGIQQISTVSCICNLR